MTTTRVPLPRVEEKRSRKPVPQTGPIQRIKNVALVPVWATARATARFPKSAAVLAAAVTTLSPVTLREVAGVVVGGCGAIGMDLYWGTSPHASGESLQQIAKFRKRRTRIRRRWVTAMADAGMAKPSVNGQIDKRRPRLRKITAEPLGVCLLVDGSLVSAGVETFLSKIDLLKSSFRCRSIKVTAAGRDVQLHLRYDEPFRRVIRFADLPPATRSGHVVVGLDEDGGPVEKDLRLPHLLCGGKGSGKSSETWAILRGIIAAEIPIRLRVFDPKGGQEFPEFEDAAWEYERDPNRWPDFIGHMNRALAAKQAAMRTLGMKKLSQYTEAFPLDVVVVDELILALQFGGNRKVKGTTQSAEEAFMTYLSTARSAGGTVIACTQLAQKDILGKVRGLFDYTTCLRVAPTEVELVNILLGSGASKAYPAHLLSADERMAGIGFTTLPRGVVKYRSAFLNDQERAAVARNIGEWTKRLRKPAIDDPEDY